MNQNRTAAAFKARHTLATALRALAYLQHAHRQTILQVVVDHYEDCRHASRLSDAGAHALQEPANRIYTHPHRRLGPRGSLIRPTANVAGRRDDLTAIIVA